ncbi:hypothetical protein LEMLEM_LOCUS10448 [Lemmus lemmus]
MPRVYLRGELSKASRAPGMMSHSQLVPSHAYECFACNSVYYVHGWGLHRPEGGIRSSGAGVTDSCEPPHASSQLLRKHHACLPAAWRDGHGL